MIIASIVDVANVVDVVDVGNVVRVGNADDGVHVSYVLHVIKVVLWCWCW